MKVTKWISYNEALEDYEESPCGGLGGWFNWNEKGQRWKDYIGARKDIAMPYLEAIRISVLENDLRLTGGQHQNISNGVPVFDDDTVATFSYRGWGDLMAAIWSEAEDKDYCYMDFYV